MLQVDYDVSVLFITCTQYSPVGFLTFKREYYFCSLRGCVKANVLSINISKWTCTMQG